MATANPRITITLTSRQHDLLRAISDCSNQPMSRFISDMIEAASPTLERMAATFKAVQKVQHEERDKFIKAMDAAQADLEPAVLDVVGQYDMFLGKMEAAASAVGAERTAAGGVASGPVTNRGATPPQAKPRKASNGKASKPIQASRFSRKKAA